MKLGISNLSLNDNAVINGDFNIWQRETSFVPIVDSAYFADRFRYVINGTMVHTITRETDVPTVSESKHQSNYSMKVDCTTAQGSIGAADFTIISHYIEGYNFVPFVGKTATLSFWVKATKTGIYCAAFRNNGIDRSYVVEYTVNSSDTWEKKEITLTFDYTGGTWDYTNGRGLRVSWTLASGSNFQGAKDTWLTENCIATSNQVNACDNVANNFSLSQVQFELGSSASDFKGRSIQRETSLCQRYYTKSYNINTNPGTIDNLGRITREEYGIGASVTAYTMFPVLMRSTPTITCYSDVTGLSNMIRDVLNNVDKPVSTCRDISDNSFSGVAITIPCAGGPPNVIAFQYTADAEL